MTEYEKQKPATIATMFDSIAKEYDKTNTSSPYDFTKYGIKGLLMRL